MFWRAVGEWQRSYLELAQNRRGEPEIVEAVELTRPLSRALPSPETTTSTSHRSCYSAAATAQATRLPTALPAVRPARAGDSGRIREPFGRHLWRHKSISAGNGYALMALETRSAERPQATTEAAPPLGKRASKSDRGVEMPIHPAGLDPIVAEIIEALAGTIAHKDNNKRGSGTRAT